MPLTPRCVSKFGPDYAAAGKWLLEMIVPSKMKLVDIEEVRVLDRQAEALVFEASNRWRDCRGRRRHVAKYNDEATMRRDRE
jgi:hypothetical protein